MARLLRVSGRSGERWRSQAMAATLPDNDARDTTSAATRSTRRRSRADRFKSFIDKIEEDEDAVFVPIPEETKRRSASVAPPSSSSGRVSPRHRERGGARRRSASLVEGKNFISHILEKKPYVEKKDDGSFVVHRGYLPEKIELDFSRIIKLKEEELSLNFQQFH